MTVDTRSLEGVSSTVLDGVDGVREQFPGHAVEVAHSAPRAAEALGGHIEHPGDGGPLCGEIRGGDGFQRLVGIGHQRRIVAEFPPQRDEIVQVAFVPEADLELESPVAGVTALGGQAFRMGRIQATGIDPDACPGTAQQPPQWHTLLARK